MRSTTSEDRMVEMRARNGDGLAVYDEATADRVVAALERDGVVPLPDLLTAEQLDGMQRAFEARLRRLRWNDYDGYEKTEPHRHMVEDVLTLDQGFVDLALHPLVKRVLTRYIGDRFELVEARGWRSLPTKRDFHGWHGDAWYDQTAARGIPREVKLAVYLTDVRSGAFNYIKGSHQRQAPRPIRTAELGEVPASQLAEMLGPAGSAFIFDTSGTHRQGVPMLEPRHAVFFNYHDPDVPLQKEDVEFYRYHPLLLNAALLGGLSEEDQRILGFGNKKNFRPAFEQPTRYKFLHGMYSAAHDANLRLADFRQRVEGRLRRVRSR